MSSTGVKQGTETAREESGLNGIAAVDGGSEEDDEDLEVMDHPPPCFSDKVSTILDSHDNHTETHDYRVVSLWLS